MRLVLATANPHKAREIVGLLPGIELVPRPEAVGDVDETEDTLEGNARLKARAVAVVAGEPAVADDTGLEVDALGGRPGVFAARYAGEDASYADNVAKLLSELAGVGAVGAAARRARFRTVALVAWPDGREIVGHGVVEGHIAVESRGEGGFGYDPVFIPDDGDGRSFAEMGMEDKAGVSHRARAFAALVAHGLGPERARPPQA